MGHPPVGGGGSYDSNSGGKGFGRVRPVPEHIGESIAPVSLQVKTDTAGVISGGVTIRDPDVASPWGQVGLGVSVSDNGTPSVSLSDRLWGLVTVAVQATLGTIGNPKCQPHP